jgi:hypothetical protein
MKQQLTGNADLAVIKQIAKPWKPYWGETLGKTGTNTHWLNKNSSVQTRQEEESHDRRKADRPTHCYR